MATIHKQLTINASADQAWERISDIGGVPKLLGMIADATVDGDRRTCNTVDGGKLDELIVAVDPDLKRVAYSITESPFGMTFHSASWQIVADGDGSRLEWFTDVKPDELAGPLSEVMESERDHFVAALEA